MPEIEQPQARPRGGSKCRGVRKSEAMNCFCVYMSAAGEYHRLMKKIILMLLVCGLAGTPFVSSAANLKPSVSLTGPDKGSVYEVSGKTPINWALKNITRDMVVVTDIKLKRADTSKPHAGYVSGAGYQHVIHSGEITGGFVHDWGLNRSIPGRYSITVELHECNPAGCDVAPAGKRIGKKSKPIQVVVKNNDGWSSGATASSTSSIEIISPNGGEEYTAGSERPLTIKWDADGVIKGSRVCVTLERKGGDGATFGFGKLGKTCTLARNGKGSVTGSLIRNSDYDLGPGEYWVLVNMIAPASRGKDGVLLADDISDDTLTLK